MTGKALSLRKPADFRKAFKEGKRFLSPHFVLYRRESGLPAARIGISIAKRHSKLAVRRNRLRRIAREVFRTEICSHSEGSDFVLASRSPWPAASAKAAAKEVKDLLLAQKK